MSCRRSFRRRPAGGSGCERELARERAERRSEAVRSAVEEAAGEPMDGFDAERIVARTQGRAGWLREAHRQLEQQRWLTAAPVPRSRAERLRLAARWLEDDLAAE